MNHPNLEKELRTKITINAITTLAILHDTDTDKIIDLLTGFLWDEEDAGDLQHRCKAGETDERN